MPAFRTIHDKTSQFAKTARSRLSSPPGPQRAWVIIGTVTAIFVLISLAAATTLVILRRRRRQRQLFRQALTRHPHMTRDEFARWRKMSDLEREEEEDRQRAVMIRKSLASRSSQWSGSMSRASSETNSFGMDGGSGGSVRSLRSIRSAGNFSLRDRVDSSSSVSALTIEEEENEEEAEGRGRGVSTGEGARQPMRLRDEWKGWERGVRGQRTLYREIHPVFEMGLPVTPPPVSPGIAPTSGSPMPSPRLPRLPQLPRAEQQP